MMLYVIRHINSNKIMPLMKKNKGYSHWNPDKNKEKIIAETNIPRFFESEKNAKIAARMWVSMPNAEYKASYTYYGEERNNLEFKNDGRKKEDIEIVEVEVNL